MKESSCAAGVLTTLLFGSGVSEFFANHGWVLFVLVAAVIVFWIFFFRKPPAAPSA